MHRNGLTFNAEQFSRIFPFFILISKELDIIECGNSLKLLFKNCDKTSFYNKFFIKRPEIFENNFDNLKTLINQLVVIECINENKTLIRGQFEFFENTNSLLFIGSPWFDSMEDVKNNNLTINDFAIHDPLIDLLHILKTQEITTDELKLLLNTVNKQKNELKTLSQIAEENNNAVIITDKFGVITWVNKSFENLTGFSLAESIGKIPGHLLQGAETDPVAKQYLKDQIYKGESFNTEILNYHKNGNSYWLRIHGRALKNKKGEVTGFFATEEDISSEKEKEKELKLSEEKYRSIISNMNLGLVEVNLKDEVQYANQSFLNISGFTFNDLKGKVLSNLLMDKDNIELLKEKNKKRQVGISDSYEVEIFDKNNIKKWWLISGAPMYNKNGEVIGSIGVHLDITEQKRLENELRIAKLEAENSSKAKEIFLTNMSHEIRTPMNAILGITKELEKTDLNEKQRYFQNIIATASNNLLVVINDILDFSKIEAGKLTLEKINFNLKEILGRIENIMLLKAVEKGITIKTYFDNQISTSLIGDPFRINQILINIVGNAIKFTDQGSVYVKAILISQSEFSQKIALVITDTGIGMSLEFIDTIFDKFTQENQSIARKFGGTGLGMTITKELVELMYGSIDIKSKQGIGTTISITIELPFGSNENNNEIADKTDLNILKNKCILLAEDNQLNRVVVVEILSRYGIDIIEATNGTDAIKLLLENKIDLILMDIQMPLLDGLQATKKIRTFNKNIPIIALTANAFKSEEQKCKTAGMNDFLSKPFNESDLIYKISTLLNINYLKPQEELKQNSPNNSSSKLYNLSKMEKMSNGDTAFIKKIASIFNQENEKALIELNSSFKQKKYNIMKATAHRIKPSIFSFNIEKIFEPILFIENFDVKNDKIELLSEKIEIINKYLTQVINDIKSTFL